MAKVTGQAKYAEDFRAEGMLFCKLLLSPRPHARVVAIDASRALAIPGVHAVLTADDLPPPPAPPAPPSPPVATQGAAARAANAPPTGPGAAGAPGTPPSAAALPPAQQTPQVPPIPPELALAKEAMYEGEPIAAVAADSEEIAAAAVEALARDLRTAPLRDRPARRPAPGQPERPDRGQRVRRRRDQDDQVDPGTVRSAGRRHVPDRCRAGRNDGVG